MKKLFTICLALVIVASVAKAQKPEDFNFVTTAEFDIVPNLPGSTMPGQVSTYTIDLNPTQLIAKFGQPTSSKTEFSEEYNSNVTNYFYDGASFTFLSDRMIEIHLTNSQKVVYRWANSRPSRLTEIYTIGGNLDAVQIRYPKSWASRQNGKVYVGILSPTGGYTDATITFTYNTSTNLLKAVNIRL